MATSILYKKQPSCCWDRVYTVCSGGTCATPEQHKYKIHCLLTLFLDISVDHTGRPGGLVVVAPPP